MRKISLLISATIAGLALVGAAPKAKADMIKIMSRPACSVTTSSGSINVGHAAIAFYDDNGTIVTKGMWPGGILTNTKDDLDMAGGGGCGLVTRTAHVSPQRRIWAQKQVATKGSTTCYRYSPIPKINLDGAYLRMLNSTGCSCVSFATRIWKEVTGEVFERQVTPKQLAKTIEEFNGGSSTGDFDGGNISP
jgi:hypothetical protein